MGGVVRVLNEEEALDRWRQAAERSSSSVDFYAFYSSDLGGVVTDVHLFRAPFDDHLVHRGHAVFDTAMVVNGQLYQLEPHLDRFLLSAQKAQLDLVKSGLTRESIGEVVRSVARAAARPEQALRFWLGCGTGGFGISPSECTQGATLYCVSSKLRKNPPEHYVEGIKVITSSIPMKPEMFATMKTTNYLPNALQVAEAEKHGAWQGVWVDEDGNVAEMATANVGFVLRAEPDKITIPSFTRTLAGVSAQRILHIAKKHLGLKVEQRQVSLSEAKSSLEAFAIGGPYLTVPIVLWDDQLIADGAVGNVARLLRTAQLRDMTDAWNEEGQLERLEECASGLSVNATIPW